MSILSLSLPQDHIKQVDQLVSRYGFANRSELVRALVRFVLREPTVVEQAATYPFVSPKTKSASKIVADFKNSKQYSSAFLKDLATGLKQSDFPKSETSQS